MVACFLSYIEYRHNANTGNIMKNRSCLGEVTYERGGQKSGVKKVDMIDVLPIQE
jgi:hypothetical protein